MFNLGIEPSATGALVVFDDEEFYRFWDTPLMPGGGTPQIDAEALRALVSSLTFEECRAAMPNGRDTYSTGLWEMALLSLKIPLLRVPLQRIAKGEINDSYGVPADALKGKPKRKKAVLLVQHLLTAERD